MIDLNKLNWSAGFYEGEGCVRINKGRSGSPWTMGFQIGNTDLESLERFRAGVAGIGKIYGPYKPRPRGTKPVYCWLSNTFEDVVALKGLLYPLLSSRRQEQIYHAHHLVAASRARPVRQLELELS